MITRIASCSCWASPVSVPSYKKVDAVANNHAHSKLRPECTVTQSTQQYISQIMRAAQAAAFAASATPPPWPPSSCCHLHP